MSTEDQEGCYAVAVCNLLEGDNKIFWTEAETPQEAIAMSVVQYAKDSGHEIEDFPAWISRFEGDSCTEDLIDYFRQGDLIVSLPTKIQVYEP